MKDILTRLSDSVQQSNHSVLTDFETAAINASHTVFQTPNEDLSVVGCFFSSESKYRKTNAKRRSENIL